MNQNKIAIIGCGNLGLSILNGLVSDSNIINKNITITKRNIDDLKHFSEIGINVLTDNIKAVQNSNIIIVALKPYKILSVLDELKTYFNSEKHILISLATGIKIHQITNIVNVPIYRAMPNTSSEVNMSMTCLCTEYNNELTNEIVENCFNNIGETLYINEDLMDAATVLGACGIAFVLRFIRGMIQGGIQIGFDATTANKIVTQTVKGAAELLIKKGNHSEFEIDKVTTPKGCTIEGLNEMEHNGFSSALIKGIVSSYNKIEK